jgi:DNA-binding NarL/FixJ family response regulator
VPERVMMEGANQDEISVVLVDDHTLFRGGLRGILEENGVRVVGEASNGGDAIDLVEEVAPDVVVMDINMPGISGVEATRRLAARAPHARVVVLTISTDDSDIVDAMMAGACGYLLKDAAIDELVGGIRAAARGESSISPRIAARLLAHMRDQQAASAPEGARADLTERELDVLRLLAAGKANADIAGELYISPKTVKNHIASILMKLQMENRIQAAVYAVRSGII